MSFLFSNFVLIWLVVRVPGRHKTKNSRSVCVYLNAECLTFQNKCFRTIYYVYKENQFVACIGHFTFLLFLESSYTLE